MLKRVGLSSLWQQRHPKTAWLCGLVPISAATGQEARGRNGRKADLKQCSSADAAILDLQPFLPPHCGVAALPYPSMSSSSLMSSIKLAR
jgi:hypothetical protein